MNHLSPEFIERLKMVRQQVSPSTWLSLAAAFRETPEVPAITSVSHLATKFLNPDPCWALRQSLKEHGTVSSIELATAMEVVDTWVSSSPGSLEIVWSGPPNGTFPIRRFDQVLYDLIARTEQRIFLVTFAAHRVPLLCEHLVKAIDRGVEVTLLLESEQASAGQLRFDAANAFKGGFLEKVSLLHWPLEKRGRNQAGMPGKLHVKCAVLDDVAIIGSANLTDDAFNRNMEMGAIIREPDTVNSIVEHFSALRKSGEIGIL